MVFCVFWKSVLECRKSAKKSCSDTPSAITLVPVFASSECGVKDKLTHHSQTEKYNISTKPHTLFLDFNDLLRKKSYTSIIEHVRKQAIRRNVCVMNKSTTPARDAQRAPAGFPRVWAFVCATMLLMTVVSSATTQNLAAQDLAQAGCVNSQMSVPQRATVKQLSEADYAVLFAQIPLSHTEYCRLSTATLRKAVTRAQELAAEAARRADAGVWSRVEWTLESAFAEGESEENEGTPPDPTYFNMRLVDENGVIPADGNRVAVAHIAAMREADKGRAAGISKAWWTALGPGNIGGRVRALAIDPVDTNILYCGGVAGGVWKSTDAGASWQNLDDFMANMAVTTIAIDPNDHTTIYAGTGEQYGNRPIDNVYGEGIFVSHNSGVTWTHLTSTANAGAPNTNFFAYVQKILLVNNASQTILYAVTWGGVAKSIDGGINWTWGTKPTGAEFIESVFDIEVSPTNNSRLLASGWGKVWLSTNAGMTWKVATGIPSGDYLVELSWSTSSPTVVYASVDINQGTIYKSTNSGASFTKISTPKHLSDQGYYDNVIWVDPTNANTIIAGGVDLFRSTNGGVTFTRISDWHYSPPSIHPDHHIIVADPGFNGTTNKKVYFGNDGGVYRTDNYKTVAKLSGWTELNNNLAITQFYSVRGDASSGNILGGTQDNGNPAGTIGSTETWADFTGGDGGYVAIDPVTPSYVYTEYVYLGYLAHCTIGVGSTCANINGMRNDYTWKATKYVIGDAKTEKALFIAPFTLDPNNANTMLAGGASLWRSTNIKATVTNTVGPIWAVIKKPSGTTADYYISAIAVAKGASNQIWVGNPRGGVWKTSNGTAAAASVTWTSYDAKLPNRFVSDIEIDPNNANIVYITFGGYASTNVWKTTDGGTTWAAATGTGVTALASLPVWSIAIHPTNSAWLYAGTELGVFTSEDSGATWQSVTDGPANVPVYDLSWMGNTLLAATHGRGIFTSDTNN